MRAMILVILVVSFSCCNVMFTPGSGRSILYLTSIGIAKNSGTVIRTKQYTKKLTEMEIEIFTLADFATDNHSKLTIVGTFDSINSAKFPLQHPMCSIACRLRFAAKESGEHAFKLRLIDADGKEVIKPIEGNINIAPPPNGQFASINIVINFNQLQFEKEGRYSFELYIDDDWKSGLPLFLQKAG